MLNNQELTALLRQNGYKVTPQRLAVYEALANTKQHPSAEMLFGTLQPKYPSMSLLRFIRPSRFSINWD